LTCSVILSEKSLTGEFPLNTVCPYEIQTLLGFINLISQFQQPPMCCRTTS